MSELSSHAKAARIIARRLRVRAQEMGQETPVGLIVHTLAEAILDSACDMEEQIRAEATQQRKEDR